MSYPLDLSTTLLLSSAAGLMTAYLAYRRGRNPISWFFAGFLLGLFGVFAFLFAPARKKKVESLPAPVPQPYIEGPTQKFWYHLTKSHEQVGPMSYTALAQLWKEGKIEEETLVWHEDLADWTQLKELVKIKA